MSGVLAGAALQYADVLYTIGGAAHYRTAHSYYAAAVDLSEGENVRALYGLCATAAQLNALRESGKVRPLRGSGMLMASTNEEAVAGKKCYSRRLPAACALPCRT